MGNYKEEIDKLNKMIDNLCILRAEKMKIVDLEKVIKTLVDLKLLYNKLNCGVKPDANIE